jgi:hypothetical protein
VISRKSVITFGMVAIPIAMYTATRDNDIHFNQLHAEDKSRIRYKKTYPNHQRVLAGLAHGTLYRRWSLDMNSVLIHQVCF